MSTVKSPLNKNFRHNGTGASTSYLGIDDVQDLSKICRLCGLVPPEPVIPLFGQECRKKQISEKINQYLSVQVDEMDPLPKTVCHSCARLIVTWHKFVNRSTEVEAKLKQRCNVQGQPFATNNQNATNLNENSNSQVVDTYTYTADSSIGTFVSALFKAQVPLAALRAPRVEADARPCPPCRADVPRHAFAAHVLSSHTLLQLHCDECDAYVDKPEYVPHVSQHAYEKAMQREKRAKRITKKILDVNLAWIVRNEFCDCDNLMCNFNRELGFKMCPTYVDYDFVTEAIARLLGKTPQTIRATFEEHYINEGDSSRRKKVLSLPSNNTRTTLTERQQIIERRLNYLLSTQEQTATEDQRQVLAEPVAEAIQAQRRSLRTRNDTTRNSSFDIYQLGPSTSNGTARTVEIINIEDEINENVPENMEGSDTQRNFNPLEQSDEETPYYPQIRRFDRARRCPYCDNVYRCSIIYLHRLRYANEESQDESHDERRTLVCDICDKDFRTEERFNEHNARHSREYRCRECTSVFLTKESLYLHRASHNGDKNFGCSKCSKSFRWRIHLEKHEKKHIVKTKYVCPTCQRVFSLKRDMLKHRRSHKVKNFKCSKCNLRFSETRYLKLHMTRKHSNDNNRKPAPKKVQASKGKPKMQVQKPKVQSKKISKK